MNVLLLSFHYPPMETTGARRPSRLVGHMPEDIRVTVLTPGAIGDARAPAVGLQRVTRRLANLGPRSDRFARDARRVRRLAVHRARTEHFDLVWCTTPPHSFQRAAQSVGHRTHLPVVVDFRDPWTDNFMRSYPTPWHRWLELRRESSVVRSAALVIANTQGHRRALLALHPDVDPSKVVVLPNGIDSNVAPAAPSVDRTDADVRPLRILHLGELYPSSTPVLEALALAVQRISSTNPDAVSLEFVGTTEPSIVAPLDALVAHGTAHLRPRVPYREVPDELSAADVLLCVVPPDAPTTVPSKLYGYLGTGRPTILIAPPGDATELAERTGGVIIIPFTQREDLAFAIQRELLSLRNGERPPPPDPAALVPLTAVVQSQQMAIWFREVASRPGPGRRRR